MCLQNGSWQLPHACIAVWFRTATDDRTLLLKQDGKTKS